MGRFPKIVPHITCLVALIIYRLDRFGIFDFVPPYWEAVFAHNHQLHYLFDQPLQQHLGENVEKAFAFLAPKIELATLGCEKLEASGRETASHLAASSSGRLFSLTTCTEAQRRHQILTMWKIEGLKVFNW